LGKGKKRKIAREGPRKRGTELYQWERGEGNTHQRFGSKKAQRSRVRRLGTTKKKGKEEINRDVRTKKKRCRSRWLWVKTEQQKGKGRINFLSLRRGGEKKGNYKEKKTKEGEALGVKDPP